MLRPDKGREVMRVGKALALRAAVIALRLGQQPVKQRLQRCGGRGGRKRTRQVLDLDTHASEGAIVEELAEPNDEIAAAVNAAIEEDLDAGSVRVRGGKYRADARARAQHAHLALSSTRDKVPLASTFRLHIK